MDYDCRSNHCYSVQATGRGPKAARSSKSWGQMWVLIACGKKHKPHGFFSFPAAGQIDRACALELHAPHGSQIKRAHWAQTVPEVARTTQPAHSLAYSYINYTLACPSTPHTHTQITFLHTHTHAHTHTHGLRAGTMHAL